MTIVSDEARALVRSQLYTTQLECDASLFLEYADVLEKVIATLAIKDPRYVYRNGQAVFVDDAIIDAYLQIDLIDLNHDNEIQSTHHWMVDGDELDTTGWRVEDFTIGVNVANDEVKQLPAYIMVEQVDYLVDDELADDADFKYKRTYLVSIRLTPRSIPTNPPTE